MATRAIDLLASQGYDHSKLYDVATLQGRSNLKSQLKPLFLDSRFGHELVFFPFDFWKISYGFSRVPSIRRYFLHYRWTSSPSVVCRFRRGGPKTADVILDCVKLNW